MVLSDFSWICCQSKALYALKNHIRNLKKPERAINPEILSYYRLNVLNECKINSCVRKADQLVAEKELIHKI